nr:hypothetical protein BSM_03910 [uncultured archaeon]CBH38836.1 hypothetical protein BSM_23130 [uncultured archaeon]
MMAKVIYPYIVPFSKKRNLYILVGAFPPTWQ